MVVCGACGAENPGGNKFCGECAAPLAALREQRKTVTVIFCDVVGSTALAESRDAEAVGRVLARYFDRMSGILEAHGGRVEKFIGDAVVAVFGVPTAHEDDALRALRAAVEMRDALPELGVEARIGVNTGEVVTSGHGTLVIGDAMNVTARLQQAAASGEIMIGAETRSLAGDAVEVEELAPLALKGKANPVAAFRLLAVGRLPERAHGSPFVGRSGELALLREAWARAVEGGRCEQVTVVGEPGVGKSRLVAEFLAGLDVRVVRGRCLSYGEGITYWPVIEVLRQLELLPPDEAVAVATRSLLGETDTLTSAEEIAWAFRKTLEHAAAVRPLVVVFDDIHWGEETFLDLIEQVALLSRGAAILLLCIARPELTGRRAAWPVALRLDPLAAKEVEQLIPDRFPDELRGKIARAAGGNPLFIEEMVAMANEAEGQVVVPPTLQALLSARLDQLERGERSVLERGSIEGEIFHRGAVQSLAPETQVTPSLAALVRKELIRPERTELAGEEGFRFRHLLIRDAAYHALAKATRAELHARFAGWLEEHGAGLAELDEVLGYHLEQACRYRAELGLPIEAELAEAARRRLTAAGRRAQLRQDSGAALTLLARAAEFVPPAEIDLALEIGLIDVMAQTGQGDEALRHAGVVAERAVAAGDRVAELCARMQAGICRLNFETGGATGQLVGLVERAMPVFEAEGDDLALYVGFVALGRVANMREQHDAGLDAFERAAEHAQRAGFPTRLVGWRGSARLNGATQVSELLAWVDEQEARGERDTYLRRYRAGALALRGRFDEARTILAETRAEIADRGGGLRLAEVIGHDSVVVELLAGDWAAAVHFGEEGCGMFDELGEQGSFSTAAGYLAQALYGHNRLEEADAWAGRAAELGATDDAATQMLWRQARAKVLARRGEYAEAERLAGEAVNIARQTDSPNVQGDALADLAEVLELGGRATEAAEAREQALALYERKGNIVMAGRVRERLVSLNA
jgi:class 3 adenylate cyclase/tetratricopeptide (TPR) repeat protein